MNQDFTVPKKALFVWKKNSCRGFHLKKKKFLHKQQAKKKIMQAENSPLPHPNPHHFSDGPSLKRSTAGTGARRFVLYPRTAGCLGTPNTHENMLDRICYVCPVGGKHWPHSINQILSITSSKHQNKCLQWFCVGPPGTSRYFVHDEIFEMTHNSPRVNNVSLPPSCWSLAI